MKKDKYNVAVVGATGAVGREMIATLEQRKFPVNELRPLASERSIGVSLEYKGEEIPVQVLTEHAFKDIDIGLFSPGGAVSKKFAPIAAEAGTVVIDNTSAFRMEPDVPLVVPEVNPESIADYKARRIIANPNCSTIQMVLILKPIQDAVGLKRVVVSTYQSTSGAGQKAMNELTSQIRTLFNNEKDLAREIFPHTIAFNCLPHIDVFQENGYTKEEMKMIWETRKILNDESLKVTATCVRVPVFFSHSESVNIETKKKITADQARDLFSKTPGVIVIDDPKNNKYPLGLDAAGKDEVFVGRIREDESVENGLNLWIVADNLRKGAALNAVQIAEVLIEKYF